MAGQFNAKKWLEENPGAGVESIRKLKKDLHEQELAERRESRKKKPRNEIDTSIYH